MKRIELICGAAVASAAALVASGVQGTPSLVSTPTSNAIVYTPFNFSQYSSITAKLAKETVSRESVLREGMVRIAEAEYGTAENAAFYTGQKTAPVLAEPRRRTNVSNEQLVAAMGGNVKVHN